MISIFKHNHKYPGIVKKLFNWGSWKFSFDQFWDECFWIYPSWENVTVGLFWDHHPKFKERHAFMMIIVNTCFPPIRTLGSPKCIKTWTFIVKKILCSIFILIYIYVCVCVIYFNHLAKWWDGIPTFKKSSLFLGVCYGHRTTTGVQQSGAEVPKQQTQVDED